MPHVKRNLFGMSIDALTLEQAVRTICTWTTCANARCRYVVTPNVDHTVLLRHHKPLQDAYAAADLVLADGLPLVLASRWLRQPLPERVAGSDLTPTIFSAVSAARPLRTFLLGAAPGVAAIAADRIHERWPYVHVVGHYSPPMGFDRDACESDKIVALVNEAEPDLLVLGFGAPKQECWIHRFRERLSAKVALCAGATIDFLADRRRRAPVWMRRCGLEWAHRLSGEPRRLAKRYAKDAWIFPQIVFQQWWNDRVASRGQTAKNLAN